MISHDREFLGKYSVEKIRAHSVRDAYIYIYKDGKKYNSIKSYYYGIMVLLKHMEPGLSDVGDINYIKLFSYYFSNLTFDIKISTTSFPSYNVVF